MCVCDRDESELFYGNLFSKHVIWGVNGAKLLCILLKVHTHIGMLLCLFRGNSSIYVHHVLYTNLVVVFT